MGKPIVHHIWAPKDCDRNPDGSAAMSRDREDELLSLSLTLGSQGKGCVPASWACRVLGVSRSAMSRAIGRGDVRVVRITLPGGLEVDLVNPEDALHVGHFKSVWRAIDHRAYVNREEAARVAKAKPVKPVKASKPAKAKAKRRK